MGTPSAQCSLGEEDLERNLEKINQLAAAGANPSVTNSVNCGALHVAASSGDTKLVQKLLRRGAAPNPRGGLQEMTAMMLAAEWGYTDIISSLLHVRADVWTVA